MMKQFIQYGFWYLRSHFCAIRADANMKKQNKYLKTSIFGEKYTNMMFRHYGRRAIYWNKKFWEIQETLDKIKEETIKMYPELGD